MSEIPDPLTGPSTEQVNPSTDNPREFMDKFYESNIYLKAKQDFFIDKTLPDDVTDKEKQEAFEQSEDAKFAMVDFARKALTFKYNPDLFPAPSAHALSTYIESVKDMMKMSRSGVSSTEIESLDSLRSIYHNTAAQTLVEDKVVRSIKLGRSLARLVLVDKGLDTFENATKKDIDQIKRKFGAV
ncbi:hypothetical protein A3C32_03455 [Candidatus Daviesbacteria bacterium RIFCSPHIGHO2_02_FULL_41_14]|uniref:Uncharacterized protein n=1 Tax=Candidatus Daviesbacteria bacterium RIFCSPLOWO2_01_FULL_40_24 TaxID=1797787 RepID=A0A1F5MJM8_9BACT|nr:MAG: hypothetical protein A2780_02880 [Candidatus Daviesbacteria bacterium RIFCSPHIGHO2_01_FULL_41_45]OGE35481.1 MAG: hypothetical protein A3C32_03455 [Candidatus Daviesbacteria bacterium RIFCSPHIGHO2_02_FULL_41_14]OGE65571.1 MAG: hypothetical protein A3B49_02035 [Candidatus Daviesbacteria bacterium RIFCSPLOWO2_01_FULL_40_24]